MLYLASALSTLVSCHSGESRSLGLPEAQEHAGAHSHARPEGGDPGDALRELPGPVHPEHDPHGGHGEKAQVRGQDRAVGNSSNTGSRQVFTQIWSPNSLDHCCQSHTAREPAEHGAVPN